MKEIKFSLYKGGITQVVPSSSVTIREVLELIQNDLDIWDKINNLRNATDPKTKAALKKQLPYVTFSGEFSKRANDGLINSSQLICVDVDHVKNAEICRVKLSNVQGCILAFVSPSGDGVKGVFHYPTNATHSQAYDHYKRAIKLMGYDIDEACKDVARACFLSSDDKPYFNEQAVPPVLLEAAVLEDKKGVVQVSANTLLPDAPYSERVEYVLKHIKSSITSTYEDWIKVGAALFSEFGEGGLNYFIEASRMDANYDRKECIKKFEQCKKMGNIGIGTFFKAAEDVGAGGTDFWKAFYSQRADKERSSIASSFTFEKKPQPTKSKANNTPEIVESGSAEESYYSFFKAETLLDPTALANDRDTRIRFGIPSYKQLMKDGYTPAHTSLSLMEWVLTFPSSFWDGFSIDDDTRTVKCEQGGVHFDLSEWVKTAMKNLFFATSAIKAQTKKNAIVTGAIELVLENLNKEIGTCDDRVSLPLVNELIIPETAPSIDEIVKMLQARFLITESDVHSLLAFAAATIRAHRYGGGKYYRSLNVVGDGGIGKDSYLPRLLGSHKGNTFEGSLTTLSGFVKVEKEKILGLQYLWISDKAAENRQENELDKITREISVYNPKNQNPFFVRKRYNTVNTSNENRSISGTNQDDTAASRRYISIELRYKEGKKRENMWTWLPKGSKTDAFNCDELKAEYNAFQARAIILSQDIQLLDQMLDEAGKDVATKLMKQRTISPVVDRMITEIVADKERCLNSTARFQRIQNINGRLCYVVGSYEQYFMDMFSNKGSAEFNKRSLIQALKCFNVEQTVLYKKGRVWFFEIRQKDLPGSDYEMYFEGNNEKPALPKPELPF